MPAEELDSLLERMPRHHLFAEIPAALRGWLLPIDWDRSLLWALELPRRRLALEELRWRFELPWWRRDGNWFHVTPREFLARPTAHPEHADRVANADLSYPLHVLVRHQRWLILDGIHRLVKAEMLGLTGHRRIGAHRRISRRSCGTRPLNTPPRRAGPDRQRFLENGSGGGAPGFVGEEQRAAIRDGTVRLWSNRCLLFMLLPHPRAV